MGIMECVLCGGNPPLVSFDKKYICTTCIEKIYEDKVITSLPKYIYYIPKYIRDFVLPFNLYPISVTEKELLKLEKYLPQLTPTTGEYESILRACIEFLNACPYKVNKLNLKYFIILAKWCDKHKNLLKFDDSELSVNCIAEMQRTWYKALTLIINVKSYEEVDGLFEYLKDNIQYFNLGNIYSNYAYISERRI